MLSPTDRRALQSVAVQFFVNGAVIGSFLPRLPEIRDRVDIDLGTLGLVMTLASVGGLAGSALCSLAISRWGSRTVMIGGGVMITASLPFIGFATTAVMLWAALAALLFFDVFADVAMNMQGSAISARRTTPVMNRLHGLWSLGTVIGGVVASGLAAVELDLRIHLLVVAVILLATMLFVAPGLLPDNGELDEDRVARERGVARQEFGIARVRGTLAVLAALGALAMILEVISGEWASLRLRDDLGASAGVAGLGYVAFTVGMVVGRFSGDSILTRIGDERLIRAGALVAAIGLVPATMVPLVGVSVVGYAITGVGVAVLFPHLYDRAAQAPGRPGAALGAMTAGSKIGSLVAPVLVGVLAGTDRLGVGSAIALVTLPAAALIIALRTADHRRTASRADRHSSVRI